jgi:mRNA interferase MazF
MTRGEIWWTDFSLPFGSEPGFRRPVLIFQSDAFNTFNNSKVDTAIVIPLTTNLDYKEVPGNVYLGKRESGLSKDSVLIATRMTVIDRHRLLEQKIKYHVESSKISKTVFESYWE